MENELFKRHIPDFNKLIDYGFNKIDDMYEYTSNIMNDIFKVIIYINDSIVIGKIYDLEFNEEYTNFRLEKNNGFFSNKVKEEYKKMLIDIRDKCFYSQNFVSNQANRISDILFTKYNTLPSFEWEKSKTDAVFKNNGKWYALIMNLDKSKINAGLGKVDILNIKLESSEILELLNKDGFYPAYHMNKKYWITIVLDDIVSDDLILTLIDKSYSYTKK